MSVAGVTSVRARMDAIESRFAAPGRIPGRIPGTAGAAAAVGGAGAPGADVTGATAGFDDSLRNALGAGAVPPSPPGVDLAPVRTATATLGDGGTVAVAAPPSVELGGAVAAGTPFASEFEAAGARYGVPPRLLAAVGWVESGYRPDAVSPAGAIGLMQIMPMTAGELGVDPTDPVQAIDGAARLLAAHHERFGAWDLALAAYHSGAGAVARAGNIPPPRAAEYVRRVDARLDLA